MTVETNFLWYGLGVTFAGKIENLNYQCSHGFKPNVSPKEVFFCLLDGRDACGRVKVSCWENPDKTVTVEINGDYEYGMTGDTGFVRIRMNISQKP